MSYAPDASQQPTSAPSYISPYPPQAYQPVTSATTTTTQPPEPGTSTRRADELARKDRTLAEFMLMLDEYDPLIPNEVTDYYLQRAGFECEDVRLKRLLSLAAQKFVSDIAADAYQHARIRTNAQPATRIRTDKAGTTAVASALARDKTRTVLTMDDLSAALTEYGISARKPEFYL
ncbi:Transcription initiation factor TFIID subunit 10 [Ceratobasidium theobromae]|uniref:Transcription initiation factor TFIID subunit 10 n=1 Tax=Ceratobasidium theobromae TaxID=1582974 RepID=A0A5N5QTL4_9AGAM|nr:Transcription initiation factor TFIID subunit 10 [Ceratobasidium theobromae]